MMTHATNNLYETYSGNKGYLRNLETKVGLNYDYVDVGVSVVSGASGATKQIGMRTVKYMNTNAITGSVPIRQISTVSGQIDATVTTAGVANTVYGINQ